MRHTKKNFEMKKTKKKNVKTSKKDIYLLSIFNFFFQMKALVYFNSNLKFSFRCKLNKMKKWL